MAAGDTSRRASVAGDGSLLDGIATGLNMMVEELAERAFREQGYRRQLLHAERLGAVGKLAAGIAHELNNPAAFLASNLGAVGGHVQALQGLVARLGETFPVGTEARQQVDRLLAEGQVATVLEDLRDIAAANAEGVRRIASIVRNLAEYARADPERAVPTRLDTVAEAAWELVAHQVAGRARVERRLDPTPPIAAMPAKLVQVITHLLLNAIQAIPEGSPDAHRILLETAREGDEVVLRVSDTGAGIPGEIRDRLFDPFVTTKTEDGGVGLGLAVAADSVRLHGGEIRFRSEAGTGTTFEVRLPLQTGLGDA